MPLSLSVGLGRSGGSARDYRALDTWWELSRSPREDVILVKGEDGWVLPSARVVGKLTLGVVFPHSYSLLPIAILHLHIFLWRLAIEEWVSVRLNAREVLHYLWDRFLSIAGQRVGVKELFFHDFLCYFISAFTPQFQPSVYLSLGYKSGAYEC